VVLDAVVGQVARQLAAQAEDLGAEASVVAECDFRRRL
jgi:hypothetical protein